MNTKSKPKKRSERVVESPPEETAAEAKARASVPPPPPRTRLACVRVKIEDWSTLNTTARHALRIPIGWRMGKTSTRPIMLDWFVVREAFAWVVEGSDHANEVTEILKALGVAFRVTPWARALRRIPAGALFTDPTGKGIKAEVETAGVPLLLRNRRGRWKRYDVAGALWPKGVQEKLAEHVVGTEGWTAPPHVAAPPRWAVEEGTLRYVGTRPRGREWHERTVWPTLHEARVEAERAAVADARLNRDIRWRIVDRGTGAKRGLWQRRKVLKEMRLTRLDLSPGLKTDRPTPVTVDVSKGFTNPRDAARANAWRRAHLARVGVEAIAPCHCGCGFPSSACGGAA